MKQFTAITIFLSMAIVFLTSCEKDTITSNSDLSSADSSSATAHLLSSTENGNSSSSSNAEGSSSLPPYIDEVCACTNMACSDGLSIYLLNPLSQADSAGASLFAVHPQNSELIEASRSDWPGDFTFYPAQIDTSWEEIELFLVVESDTSAPQTITPEWDTFICNQCTEGCPQDYNSHASDTLEFVFE